ncbi:MAG: zinc ribbon domain-containing protein [Desulfatiglandaceae bacterium]
MPIYEYETRHPGRGCKSCKSRFEVIQNVAEMPLSVCPDCGARVKKVISWCRAAVVETSEESASVEKKIREYEGEGMWSHAAELADTHSEKTKDKSMKTRALDDYKKAGYDPGTLDKHSKG